MKNFRPKIIRCIWAGVLLNGGRDYSSSVIFAILTILANTKYYSSCAIIAVLTILVITVMARQRIVPKALLCSGSGAASAAEAARSAWDADPEEQHSQNR